MGQIIGSAAKPKRCNLNKLSQLGTPAAGEHILVSSDNSMNAVGQGNFDCYIVGDGRTAATALELKSIADLKPTVGSKNSVTSGSVYNITSDRLAGYTSKDLTRGGFYNLNTGEYTANNNYSSAIIEIPSEATYIIARNYRDNPSYEGVVIFDGNDNVVFSTLLTKTFSVIKRESNWAKIAINAIFSYAATPNLLLYFALHPILADTSELCFSTGDKLNGVGLVNSISQNGINIPKEVAVNDAIVSNLVKKTLVNSITYTQTHYNQLASLSLEEGKRYRVYFDITGDVNSKFIAISFYNGSTNVYTETSITDFRQLVHCVVDFTPSQAITGVRVRFNSLWSGSLNVSVVTYFVENIYADEEMVGQIASEKAKEELVEETVIQNIDYTQNLHNPPFQQINLPAGKEYKVHIEITGNDLGKLTQVSFYNSQSGSSLVHSYTLTSTGVADFSFTPENNVNYYKVYFNSSWTGEANISIVAKINTDKYLSADKLPLLLSEYNENIVGLSINVFGDVLPLSFKEKMMYGDNDLLIVCQGDSITGLVQNCDEEDVPSQSNPFGQYKSWVPLMQKQVGKVKPYYNRLDSVRDGSDFFTKVGTWEQATTETFSPSGTPALLDNSRENSVTALTYRSISNDASASFSFDASTYDKCNIIYTKNKEAGSMVVTIQEGNGKMLASLDRKTWVEANGFQHTQATIAPTSTNGEAACERHRRLWMKKADGVSETLHITYSRSANDGTYVYFWGTEMYSGRAFLFDNIGRGGRTIGLLSYNISDVFDRNPDLTLLEMPITNDIYHHTTESELFADYDVYFGNNGNRSYKVRSNDYEDYPIIIVLPHTRASFFDGNAAIMGSTTLQTIRTAPAYCIYKKVFGYLYQQLKNYPNVSFINLCDQFLNEAEYKYGDWQTGLDGGNLTADSTHLNQRGSDIYRKYLSAIFQ